VLRKITAMLMVIMMVATLLPMMVLTVSAEDFPAEPWTHAGPLMAEPGVGGAGFGFHIVGDYSAYHDWGALNLDFPRVDLYDDGYIYGLTLEYTIDLTDSTDPMPAFPSFSTHFNLDLAAASPFLLGEHMYGFGFVNHIRDPWNLYQLGVSVNRNGTYRVIQTLRPEDREVEVRVYEGATATGTPIIDDVFYFQTQFAGTHIDSIAVRFHNDETGSITLSDIVIRIEEEEEGYVPSTMPWSHAGPIESVRRGAGVGDWLIGNFDMDNLPWTGFNLGNNIGVPRAEIVNGLTLDYVVDLRNVTSGVVRALPTFAANHMNLDAAANSPLLIAVNDDNFQNHIRNHEGLGIGWSMTNLSPAVPARENNGRYRIIKTILMPEREILLTIDNADSGERLVQGYVIPFHPAFTATRIDGIATRYYGDTWAGHLVLSQMSLTVRDDTSTFPAPHPALGCDDCGEWPCACPDDPWIWQRNESLEVRAVNLGGWEFRHHRLFGSASNDHHGTNVGFPVVDVEDGLTIDYTIDFRNITGNLHALPSFAIAWNTDTPSASPFLLGTAGGNFVNHIREPWSMNSVGASVAIGTGQYRVIQTLMPSNNQVLLTIDNVVTGTRLITAQPFPFQTQWAATSVDGLSINFQGTNAEYVDGPGAGSITLSLMELSVLDNPLVPPALRDALPLESPFPIVINYAGMEAGPVPNTFISGFGEVEPIIVPGVGAVITQTFTNRGHFHPNLPVADLYPHIPANGLLTQELDFSINGLIQANNAFFSLTDGPIANESMNSGVSRFSVQNGYLRHVVNSAANPGGWVYALEYQNNVPYRIRVDLNFNELTQHARIFNLDTNTVVWEREAPFSSNWMIGEPGNPGNSTTALSYLAFNLNYVDNPAHGGTLTINSLRIFYTNDDPFVPTVSWTHAGPTEFRGINIGDFAWHAHSIHGATGDHFGTNLDFPRVELNDNMDGLTLDYVIDLSNITGGFRGFPSFATAWNLDVGANAPFVLAVTDYTGYFSYIDRSSGGFNHVSLGIPVRMGEGRYRVIQTLMPSNREVLLTIYNADNGERLIDNQAFPFQSQFAGTFVDAIAINFHRSNAEFLRDGYDPIGPGPGFITLSNMSLSVIDFTPPTDIITVALEDARVESGNLIVEVIATSHFGSGTPDKDGIVILTLMDVRNNSVVVVDFDEFENLSYGEETGILTISLPMAGVTIENLRLYSFVWDGFATMTPLGIRAPLTLPSL